MSLWHRFSLVESLQNIAVLSAEEKLTPKIAAGLEYIKDSSASDDEVKQFIKSHFDASKFEALRGKVNLFVVMPSSSIASRVLADLLINEFGGEPYTSIRKLDADLKSRHLKGKGLGPKFSKVDDPSTLEGWNVVIVDDLISSGRSVNSMVKTLENSGIKVDMIAALAGYKHDLSLPSEKDIKRLSQSLAKGLAVPEQWLSIRKVVEDALGDLPRGMLTQREKRLHSLEPGLRKASETARNVFADLKSVIRDKQHWWS